MGARANIGTAREVVDITWDSWVFGSHVFGDGKEVRRRDHSVGDADAELLNLFSNVLKKGIARPLADKHDSVDRDISQVHSHCCTGTDRVGSHLHCLKTECVLSY